ncbi:hypothetical protein PAAG_05675 [Paracoccidioides lutzii Pb01]|uniref:Uncharacterized protein n=1 Tax=Paracoccidioides lutzii (strain ATCC MYA-826 / Pb01) TaxID=502779 RepID=C1H4I2_PARBA|nr:hypothetical protein PAAG_05675 [Paracoccidioides lutzii Pb01]EEH34626.2 hypothetical protein PAAG_05675 [Paracoccidioides lutzii Pb01]
MQELKVAPMMAGDDQQLLLPMTYDPVHDTAREKKANERRDRILVMYSKIYAVAKLFLAVLTSFAVEMDDGSTSIKYHVDQVEAQMTQDSIPRLLETIEDLFYILNAHLNIEISNVQFCESFQRGASGDIELMRNGRTLAPFIVGKYLPNTTRVHMIFQACKRLLKSDDICGLLDRELIHKKQMAYVERVIEVYAANNLGVNCHLDDLRVYRGYIERVVSSRESLSEKEWTGLDPMYNYAPCMILATMSEKYLRFTSQRNSSNCNRNRNSNSNSNSRSNHGFYYALATGADTNSSTHPASTKHNHSISTSSSNFSFTSSSSTTTSSTSSASSTDRLLPKHRYIEANREAAYARLEGISVGEFRRFQGKRSLHGYVRDQLCVCLGHCACSRKCTVKEAPVCPCSARLSDLSDDDDDDDDDDDIDVFDKKPVVTDSMRFFSEHCADLARELADGLCTVRVGPDMTFFEVYIQIKKSVGAFHQEVLARREEMMMMM